MLKTTTQDTEEETGITEPSLTSPSQKISGRESRRRRRSRSSTESSERTVGRSHISQLHIDIFLCQAYQKRSPSTGNTFCRQSNKSSQTIFETCCWHFRNRHLALFLYDARRNTLKETASIWLFYHNRTSKHFLFPASLVSLSATDWQISITYQVHEIPLIRSYCT